MEKRGENRIQKFVVNSSSPIASSLSKFGNLLERLENTLMNLPSSSDAFSYNLFNCILRFLLLIFR